MKPFKWHGFQMGNRFVAEFLGLHAGVDCELIVTSDARAFEEPWQHDSATSAWSEDLRSRWFWESLRHDRTPPVMCCAVCDTALVLPTTEDGDALRNAGYFSPNDAHAPMPLIVGRYLWFCGEPCRAAYSGSPGRIWRACPASLRRLSVGCGKCRSEHSCGALDGAAADAEAFAEWLCEHIFDPPSRTDVDDPAGCRLTVNLTVNRSP
jgi:hypothetical protein